MLTAMDGADIASSSPCEIILELVRATETENPFAFVLEEQSYVRHLEGGAGRSGSFPWSEQVFEHLAAVQRERANPEAAAWLAEELRLFLGKLAWDLDEESIRKAIDAGRSVHLTLRLGAAELYALPWELVPLGATGRPLGSLRGFLLRYEWPDTRTARPEPDPPPEGGRILFAWSTAGGVVPAEEHLAAIRRACIEGRHPDFDRARDVVPHASLGRLREALRAGPVAVLHILCHGAQLDDASASYGLVLDADDRSGTEIVDARALQVALTDHLGSLRLVVLCACHSGDPGALDSRLGSVAQALHRAGVPVVVASRYPLASDASVVLAEALYRGLLVQARSLADAFLYARNRLRERASRSGWASLQMYARAADGSDLRPVVHRPYRGLLAFQEEHARYFFGRDAEVEETLGDLSALVAAKDAAKPRFLICTGASGTGKSSLVLAGVVPALRARDRRWVVANMRPHDGWRMSLQAALASRTDPEAPLLLFVDQLEELFTMISSHAEREAFVRDLWSLASHAGSGVSVVATLRVDFLARCGEIQLWSGDRFLEDMAYDEAHRVFVRRMKPEHLRRIIELPAEQVGLSLEEGLCEQMLKDAGDEPGALPLLEYTLDQMWQQRRRRSLTWEQYNELGGVGGALEKKADAILAGFDEVRRQAARRLLVQLVTLDGDARLDRRRRVPLDKLRRGSPVEAAVFGEVLDALARERLLVMSGGDEGAGPRSRRGGAGEVAAGGEGSKSSVVEVAHEQLIRSWGTLRAWVREDRQMLAELQKLDHWVEESKGFPSYVLDDDRLGHARDILARYAVDVGEAARELILRSERAATRKRRWAVGTAIAASVAAVVMGVLAIWAMGERDTARLAESKAKDAQTESEQQTRNAQEASAKEKQQATLANEASEEAKRQEKRARDAQGEALEQASWARDAEQEAKKQKKEAENSLVVAQQQKTLAEDASVRANQQAKRAWNASLVAGARELLARDQGTAASRLLADVSEPDTVDGWAQTAHDVLVHGVPRATLRGHLAGVSYAAWSPDGKRIVTASPDYTVRVWNAEGVGDPVVLRWPKGDDSKSESTSPHAAFSHDGKRIVAVSYEGIACVWNADGSGEPIVLRHKGRVTTAAFSLDSNRIVTASKDKTARVWNSDGSGTPLDFQGHTESVKIAAFTPNGTRIVTTSEDGTARIWNADRSGEPVVLHTGGYKAVTFSPNGERIVTEHDNYTARIWNMDGSGEPVVLQGHTTNISDAAFSPDGMRIVTASQDNTARVWSSTVSGPALAELFGHGDTVASAAWSPNGDRIVTASFDHTARIWSADRGFRHPQVLREHKGLVHSAAWSPDGGRIVTASRDQTARVWSAEDYMDAVRLKGSTSGITTASLSEDGKPVVADSHNGTRIWSAYGYNSSNFTNRVAGAFSPDGKHIATGSANGTVRIWSADGSSSLVLGNHGDRIYPVVFSPDGKRVVTGSADGTARIWSADGSSSAIVLNSQSGKVLAAAFSPDGKTIVTGSSDGTARVWSADGSSSLVLEHHGEDIYAVAFSPDGSRVVITSKSKFARIWNADGSGPPIVLRGPEAMAIFVAFSSDGKRVVTASPDGSVGIWSADGSSMSIVMRNWRIHTDDIPVFAAFSPDGKRVVTASAEGLLQSWAISVEVLQQSLREATTECLSAEMRQTYLGESVDKAQAGYKTCETSYGRTPL